MSNRILFKEKQRFSQWWLWLILIVIDSIFILGTIMQIMEKQEFGNNPLSNTGLFIITGCLILFSLMFLIYRLETQITEAGIFYRAFPFQKNKKISWEKISKAYIKEYKPLSEYYPRRFRIIGLMGSDQASIVSGNKGLQLVFVNGENFLIGTQRPEDMKQVLQKLGRFTRTDQ